MGNFTQENCYCKDPWQMETAAQYVNSVNEELIIDEYIEAIQNNIKDNKLQFQMQGKTHLTSEKGHQEKTTTGDDQKKSKITEKLTSHNAQVFREIDINDYELNFTDNFSDLQTIDELVTPLIYCAYFGLKEICRHLLRNKKIDVDLETSTNRQTPLIVACMRGNYQIVRLLVLANAEINKPNALNQSPLTAVIYRLADEPVSFENTCICFRMAEFLIDHGADVNWVVDKNRGFSLLHYFCSVKVKMNSTQKDLNYRIIKFLLEKGADLNQKTLKDQTVWDLLETHCNKQNLVALIQQHRNKPPSSRIPRHNIKRLGEDYFKTEKCTTEDLDPIESVINQ